MRIVTAILLAGLGVCLGSARADDDEGDRVETYGCVYQGIEEGCLILFDGRDKYVVSRFSPRPAIGSCGTIRGIVTHRYDYCLEGTKLSSASWRENDASETSDEPRRRRRHKRTE